MNPSIASDCATLLLPKAGRSPKKTPSSMPKSGGRMAEWSIGGKISKPLFDTKWHDAKEIVVPFDASKYDVQLVNEKDWAAAYTPNRASPPVRESLRLETRRVVGRVVRTPGWRDNVAGFLTGCALMIEILLVLWTAALLVAGFPLSNWLAWPLGGVWALALIGCKFWMPQAWPFHGFLWLGSGVTTLAWLTWSPWSHEVVTQLGTYFQLG